MCFYLTVKRTGVNTVNTLIHSSPTFHFLTLFCHIDGGSREAESYFRFHHFLFIFHRFHSNENNHISIQAFFYFFFTDFKYAYKHFVLCQAFGVFTKLGWEISMKLNLSSSYHFILRVQVICYKGSRNFSTSLLSSRTAQMVD